MTNKKNNVSYHAARKTWCFQITCLDGKRRKVFFKSKTTANTFASNALQLLDCLRNELPAPTKVVNWIKKQENTIVKKLVTLKLWQDLNEKLPNRLDDFGAYFVSRKKSEPRKAELAIEKLQGFLAKDYRYEDHDGLAKKVKGRKNPLLCDITFADAKEFYNAMLETFSEGYTARTIGYLREMYTSAIKNKVVEDNPFLDSATPATVKCKEDDYHYIPLDDCTKILDAIGNDDEAALAFVLMRFLGFRNCSELNALEYQNIDWENDVIKVWDSKRKRFRFPPLLPVVKPYLLKVCENMTAGQIKILTKTPNKTYRQRYVGKTGTGGYLGRAGLKVWPRIFVNLRRSAVCDLHDAGFPAYVVNEWCGHNEKVSNAFYKRANRQHYTNVKELPNPLENVANAPERAIEEL